MAWASDRPLSNYPDRGRAPAGAGAGGFTLVEMLVTMSIAAILLAIAVPNFGSLIASNRATATANELLAVLNYARSESIKRGIPVTVCKCADPAAATPVCSTAAGWQDGWLVFTDGGTVGTLDGTDIRLRIGQPSGQGITLSADGNYSNFITYLANGSSQGNGGASTGSLTICATGNQRSVNIGATGRIQVTSGTC